MNRLQTDEEEIEWTKNLRKKIYSFLCEFIDKKYAKEMVSLENMTVWRFTFTHETYSEKNYEELEFFGDRLFNGTFAEYLLSKNKYLDKADFTEIYHDYTSNNFLQTLFTERKHKIKNFKFGDHLRTLSVPLPVPLSMLADIVEAINAAIFITGSQSALILSPECPSKGVGYEMCRKYCQYIYDDIEIETNGDLRGDISMVQQNLKKIDNAADPNILEDYKIVKNENDVDNHVFTIKITDKIKNFLQSLKPDNIITKIIGRSEHRIKDTARKMAYKSARTSLEKWGLTKEVSYENAFWKIFTYENTAPYKEAVIAKLKAENIKYILVKQAKKVKKAGGTIIVTAVYNNYDSTGKHAIKRLFSAYYNVEESNNPTIFNEDIIKRYLAL